MGTITSVVHCFLLSNMHVGLCWRLTIRCVWWCLQYALAILIDPQSGCILIHSSIVMYRWSVGHANQSGYRLCQCTSLLLVVHFISWTPSFQLQDLCWQSAILRIRSDIRHNRHRAWFEDRHTRDIGRKCKMRLLCIQAVHSNRTEMAIKIWGATDLQCCLWNLMTVHLK